MVNCIVSTKTMFNSNLAQFISFPEINYNVANLTKSYHFFTEINIDYAAYVQEIAINSYQMTICDKGVSQLQENMTIIWYQLSQ